MLLFILLFLISLFLLKKVYDNDDEYPGLLFKNNYKRKVKIKTESQEVRYLTENKSYPIKIDGINTFIKKNKIYIVRNGTNVYIKKNENVAEYSLISWFINR